MNSFKIFLASTFVFVATSLAWADKSADISLTSDGIYVSSIPSSTYLQLKVVAPDGSVVCDLVSDGELIVWNITTGLQNGQYSYEVRQSSATKKVRGESNQSTESSSEPYISSGGFLLKNSGIVPQDAEEASINKETNLFLSLLNKVGNFIIPSAHAADDVHVGNFVIQGNECVGVDCTDAEVFGYDAIRLKKNNLRIHFDDSSVGSFPANDWRIIINDVEDGGQSLFAIEDSTADRRPFTIEAAAPVNSLYVEDGGKIGLGTSTPSMELHVVDGDSPTLRLDQDGSSGFTPQTWDVAGNETNFFIRDVTNGSLLPFKIKPNSPANTLTLHPEGKVGINTNSPTHTLHVVGDALITGNLELGSSRSIKNNIYDLDTATANEAFSRLQPVRFHYNNAPDEESLGFIAEDVPALVATKNRNSLSTMDIVAVLTKVVQQQQESIATLKISVEKMNADMKSF